MPKPLAFAVDQPARHSRNHDSREHHISWLQDSLFATAVSLLAPVRRISRPPNSAESRLASRYDYNSDWTCWQDFQTPRWQLASLHRSRWCTPGCVPIP